MSLETTTIMIALIPFLAIWGLLRLALGAAAAPDVRRTWSGEWVVSMRLALTREGTVGTITRITNDLFRRLDRQDPPRLRVVLLPQEPRPARRVLATDSPRSAGRLSRAA
jgi:hypothetical protein